MAKSHSIRSVLLRDQILLILVLGASLLGATFVGATRTVRGLSRSLVTQAVDQTEAELDGFFEPARGALETLRSWSDFAPLDAESGGGLVGVFLRQNPQFSRAHVAGPEGDAISVQLGEDGLAAAPVGDVSASPWFVGAVARREAGDASVFWTEPYELSASGESGLTASLAVDTDDDTFFVMAFDLRLADVHGFIRRTHVSENGGVAVLTTDNRLVALSDHPLFGGSPDPDQVLLRQPLDLGTPLIRAASEAFAERRDQGLAPFSFTSGSRLWWGQVRVYDLASDRQLVIAALVPNEDLLGDASLIRIWILVTTMVVLAAAVTRAIAFSRRLSRPIEELVRRSDAISRGELDDPAAPVASRLTDVRVLSDAQDRMRSGLRSLVKLEGDLALARQIQKGTLPRRLPELSGFELAGWSEAADETGGDTYDVIGFRLGDDGVELCDEGATHAAFLLADATGHGIGPALSVTQIRAMIRMAVRARESLASAAQHLNEQLFADLPGNRFITAWIGLLDAGAGELTSFSAGQAPLLHYQAESGEVSALRADAPPLGMVPKIPIRVPPPIHLGRGDVFVVLSDGFYEATSPAGTELGQEGIEAVLRRHSGDPAEALVAALRAAVDDFTGHAPFDDDRTAVVIRRAPA
ncbi:MAG: SpoIIE family protein phosphatase [Thermoanaerobaculia bacterium]|nr:SpoIIE family protein phosphatase [Thermoanaerobaculia bacterium]